MPARIEVAMMQHRNALMDRDEQTARSILTGIDIARKKLAPLIASLQAELNSTEMPKGWKLYQLARWRQLEAELNQQMTDIARRTGVQLTADQRHVIQTASEEALKLTQAATAKQRTATALARQWTALPTQALIDLVGNLSPSAPLGGLLESFGATAAETAREALIEGTSQSQTAESVGKAIAKALDITQWRALTIARTELLRTDRGALLNVYAANDDILDGWARFCRRSGRVCAACLALDGQVFPLSVQFYQTHPNCVCGARPVLKEGGVDLPPASEWFAAQSDDVKRQVLGKSGAEAFKAGLVRLSDFIRPHESNLWGKSYTDGGIGWALEQAKRRAA